MKRKQRKRRGWKERKSVKTIQEEKKLLNGKKDKKQR